MARRKVNKQQLLMATEELLLERGYNGFHFRALAEKLKIGRSTIYEYYSSKEELILDYMHQMMREVLTECEEWVHEPPLERLKGYLSVFMKYTQIHQMIQILPLMDRTRSPDMDPAIDRLFVYHRKIYSWIVEAINHAKNRGEIRQEIPTQLITALIFSSVQLPRLMDGEESISGEMIFDLFHRGFHP